MIAVDEDRGKTSGSGSTAVLAPGSGPFEGAVLPAPPERDAMLEAALTSAKNGRISGDHKYEHICAKLGRRGFVADERLSADGTYVDLVVSSLQRELFGFLAMPKWSYRTDGMAKGGYERLLSHVRVSSTEPNVFRPLGGVVIDAYKNFSVALNPDGSGFAFNVDSDSHTRGVVKISGRGGGIERELRIAGATGDPIASAYDGTGIRDLEYDSSGNLHAFLKTGFGDGRWERITG